MTLLSPDELRLLVPGVTLGDEALQILLDAAEQEITQFVGSPPGDVTELHVGGTSGIVLRQEAAEIGEITETIWDDVVTVEASDWRLWTDRVTLLRVDTGVNPSARTWGFQTRRLPIPFEDLWAGAWGGAISVTYTPVDNVARRKKVQAKLIGEDLDAHPGLTAQSIGAWSEQYASAKETDERRLSILAELTPASLGFA